VAAKVRPLTAKRARPTFKPDTNGGRLKSATTQKQGIQSSGYGLKKKQETCDYTPKPHLRGELARKKLGLDSTPTFQPQLFLSKTAQKLKKQTESRLLQKSAGGDYIFVDRGRQVELLNLLLNM
jgi:hypothetical protein